MRVAAWFLLLLSSLCAEEFIALGTGADLHSGGSAEVQVAQVGSTASSKEGDEVEQRNQASPYGSVNPITGRYSEEHVDQYTVGPEAQLVVRSWQDGGWDQANAWGWNINNSLWGQEVSTREYCGFLGCEPNGAVLEFRNKKKYTKGIELALCSDCYRKNWCNTALGEIGGATSIKTMRVELQPGEEIIHDPDGSKRHLQSVGARMYVANLEEKLSGRTIRYDWQRVGHYLILKSMVSFGPQCGAISGIDLRLHGTMEEPIEYVTSTGDWAVRYHFEKRGNRWWVSQVAGQSGPDWQRYSYSGDHIRRRDEPNGRFVETYYWGDANLSALMKPYQAIAGDPRCDQELGPNFVACQRAPVGEDETPITVARYYFRQIRGKDRRVKGGATEVFDANDNLKIIRWNQKNRIERVEHWDASGQKLMEERMGWFESEDARDGNLNDKTVIDCVQKRVLYSKLYQYDNRYNVAQETLSGTIQEEGSNDFHVTHRTYAANLLVRESKKPGVETLYKYKPGTNLLIEKIEKHQRTLFEYNRDGLLTEEVVDAGGERQITRITPKAMNPGICQPECIEKFYVAHGQEILKSRTRIEYDHNSHRCKESFYDADDRLLYALHYVHDHKGRLLKETDKWGNEISYRYDANNNRIFVQERPDVWKEMEYDYSNRLIAVHERHADGRVFTQRTAYNYLNQPVRTQDAFGNKTLTTPNLFGHPVRSEGPAFLGAHGERIAPVVERSFDALGNVLEEKDPMGGVTRTSWNAYKKPLRVQYPDGTSESFSYSLLGTLTKKVNKDGSYFLYELDDQERITKEELCDRSGKPLSVRHFRFSNLHLEEEVDGMGVVTRYAYDGAGRVVEKVVDRARTTYAYDALGEVAVEKRWVNQTQYLALVTVRDRLSQVVEERVEDERGVVQKRVSYQYDHFGRKVVTREWIDEAHSADTLMEYNSSDEVIAITDAEGKRTRYLYNREAVDGLGQRVLEKTTIDPCGNRIVETADALGRIMRVEHVSFLGHRTALEETFYNALDQRVRVVEQVLDRSKHVRDYVVAWKYSAAGKVTEEVRGLGSGDDRVYRFAYDDVGRLIEKSCPGGSVIHYAYDERSRLVRTDAVGVEGTEAVSYEFVYNTKNEIIQVKDLIHNTVNTRRFDSLGCMVEETLPSGLHYNLEVDPLGRKKQLTLPDQTTVGYRYEGSHLLSVQRKDCTHRIVERNLRGQVLRAEGLCAMQRTYDLMGRCCAVQCASWQEGDSHFDAADNLLSYTLRDSEGTLPCSFTYDDLYQLTSEKTTLQRTYRHDSLYNRVAVNDTECTVNALNELLSDHNGHFLWDKNGNLLSKEGFTYGYDALDRMIAVYQNDELLATYTYDSFNRRISKTTSAATTHFLYDGQCEIGSYENGHATSLRILADGPHGSEIGAAVLIELPEGTFFPVHDHRGCLTSLETPDGTSALTVRYTAFGEETLFGSIDCPWRFSSKRVDPETHFVYFGARFLDPAMGRWTTADPEGFHDGFNLYAYVKNCPQTHLDPWGLFGFDTIGNALSRMDRMFSDALNSLRSSYLNSTVKKKMNEIAGSFGYALKKALTPLGRAISVFGKHLCPIPALRRVLEGVGCLLSGDKLSDESRSKVRYLNDDQKGEGGALVYTNGIGTSEKEFMKYCREASAECGNPFTACVYNASHGFIMDFFECCANKLGVPTAPARLLNAEIKKLVTEIGPNALITIQAHSQGGITAYLATQKLPENIARRLEIYTYGTGALIPNGKFMEVENHGDSNDLVFILANIPTRIAAIFGDEYTITQHETGNGFINEAHGLGFNTYKNKITDRNGKWATRENRCARSSLF